MYIQCMARPETHDQQIATAISALVYANPFLEERIDLERRILGEAYVASQPFWSLEPDLERKSNIDRIAEVCAALVERFERKGAVPEDVAVYFLYERYREAILETIEHGPPAERVAFYPRFRSDVQRYLGDQADAAHLFACFFQVRRAFHHIFRNIVGRSLPAARLRAAVWESIFTHDMRRFRRSVYARLGDVPTLITGPTGTGKELVARAIGLSRYVPFDERREKFTGDPAATFMGLNPSALSPTLIESELFGHRKGAFTGAIADHEGFLESSGAMGTVFLDEVGELEPVMQVKLLRVIQSRTFQRLGDTTLRKFEGKLIAATNRDLAEEMRAGRFRQDFFYRLCADTIVTPALREQLDGGEAELRHLVRFISARVAGEPEAEQLTEEVLRVIDPHHAWPGNFRELEQCVRSVMLRGSYIPSKPHSDARRRIADGVVSGSFTADDLLRNYCTLLYAKTRNYSHVAEKLGVDRRTVRARIDERLLGEL
jgi:transcriptional regulator with AAA-type ATPase domain